MHRAPFRLVVCCALLCCTALRIGSLHAAEEDADLDLAKAHYALGEAHYGRGDFEAALKEFETAYSLVASPPLLFNMAACHEELGNPEQALELYRRYLKEDPATADRAEVALNIVELEAKIAAAHPPAESRPVTPPPLEKTDTIGARAAPAPLDPVRSIDPEPISGASPVSAATRVDAAPKRRPITSRWWFWTGSGIAVAVAGGMAVLAWYVSPMQRLRRQADAVHDIRGF